MNKNQTEFQCMHCDEQITNQSYIGTSHRNHCPFCLWSKHVDEQKAGDRLFQCQRKMEPIGLTFKHEGLDKYGNLKQGEIMIVHSCMKCRKININRIAADDNEDIILSLLNQTDVSKEVFASLHALNIDLLGKQDKGKVHKQLFGIDHASN